MAGKTNRLSKVAREFNVGISTIVDFMAKKGFEIDASPNTKIDNETYTILQQEYAADQTLKEKSKQTTVKREKRETITLKDAQKPSEDEDEEDSKLETEVTEKIAAREAEKAEAKAEAEEAAEEVEDTPEKETPAKETVSEEESKAPVIEVSDDQSNSRAGGLNVVGKIDLSALNQKTRPDKKAKKKKEEPAKKEIKKEEPVKESPKAEEEKVTLKEEVKTEAKKKEPEVKKEPEFIKTKSEKLTGPTVVGKIELPQERKKTKKKTDEDSEENKRKRKRKRIKKVNVDKQSDNTRKPGGSPGAANTGGRRGAPKKRAEKKPEVTEEEIQKEIKKTLERLSGGKKNKSAQLRREKRQAVSDKLKREQEKQEVESRILKITEYVTVSELASMMDAQPTEIISACMSLGIFASINQRLDAETLTIIAEEFGFGVEFVSAEVTDTIQEVEDDPKDLIDRSPIVTVMGHVDHGKTSLLDHIRKANVIAGEAGGITQHIGAYSVKLDGGKTITFLDTPGHEAFTAMRARGAQVTDVAIIIIAADDNVMPQTKEAISHAQAAGVPMVFAINKIDKPGANPDRVREELSKMNILVEDWGGKFQCQEISAKSGLNIDELLEKVLLEAELLELKANPNKNGVGTVIEASLDKGRGFVTTILVQAGTMKVGDMILAGPHYGRVKAMFNERSQRIEVAGPSTPVSILGLSGAPSAGDKFHIMDDEKEAKAIATKREQLQREQGIRTKKHITLDEIGRRLAVGDFKELNVIVKGDVDGSIEALSDSLIKMSTQEIQVNIIHKGVGQITETDVLLASASDAIIIGFQVRPSVSARKLAENEEIDIRLYSIIYKAIEEIKSAMEGMLSPDIEEKIIGTAEIRETFKISKVGTIAGCFVTEGKIFRNSTIRLIRDGVVIYTGGLGSLKRFKDDVKEVKNGYECGLNVDKYNDIKVGDIVEAYEEIEVAKKL